MRRNRVLLEKVERNRSGFAIAFVLVADPERQDASRIDQSAVVVIDDEEARDGKKMEKIEGAKQFNDLFVLLFGEGG
jgi:hypothetical protein